MTARLAFWFLAGATVVVFLFMVFVTGPHIQQQAGGLTLPEAMMGGYGFDEAKAFLAALSPEGRTYYLGPQGWLDTAFPALFAVTFYAALVVLLRPWLGGNARFVAVLAVVPAIFDWLENAAVATMLRAGADALTQDMVASASRWTVLKWTTYMLLIAVTLVLAAFAVQRLRKERSAGTLS